MKRPLIWAGLAGVLLVAIAATLAAMRHAYQTVPAFYTAALAADTADQQIVRDRFVAHATTLASDLRRPGPWQSTISADEINAWLALELTTQLPGVLHNALHDPRVDFSNGVATIACRYEREGLSSVVSISLYLSLPEPNLLAIEIRNVRAGSLPMPLGYVLDAIGQAAGELNLPLQWRKTRSGPVALVRLRGDDGGAALVIEEISLRQGKLFVAGNNRDPYHPRRTPEAPDSDRAASSDEADHQPRVGSAAKETSHE